MMAQRIDDAKARATALNYRVDHSGERHHEPADNFNRKGERYVSPYKVCDEKIYRRAVFVDCEALQILNVDCRFKVHALLSGLGKQSATRFLTASRPSKTILRAPSGHGEGL